MDMKITSRLLIMMFVQYFMQGAWNMTMGLVLSSYGMASIIGNAYALLGVATIISLIYWYGRRSFLCFTKSHGDTSFN